MASKTSRDEGTNSAPGGQNVSKVPNLGAAQQSSNDWMGIEDRIGKGTIGARSESSHSKYGGDYNHGYPDSGYFKGTSSNVDNSTLKQLNAGNAEKASWNSMGQYGPGSPNYLAGGFGAREQMTIGGDGNKGKYVGDGVNATPDTDVTQYLISGKVPVQMPNNQYLAGTDEARGAGITGGNNSSNESGGDMNNMIRSKKGIGKGGPRRDTKNQVD